MRLPGRSLERWAPCWCATGLRPAGSVLPLMPAGLCGRCLAPAYGASLKRLPAGRTLPRRRGMSAPVSHVPVVSVVVPVRNEAENVAPLVDEIAAALAGRVFEVIYVNDGSSDGTD